jgi:hypothetical protein
MRYEDLQMLEAYVDFELSSVDYDPERGVPTSFRAPLYPAFLALIYFFTGSGAGRFFAVRLVQAGLGALLAPLTYQDRQTPLSRTRACPRYRSLDRGLLSAAAALPDRPRHRKPLLSTHSGPLSSFF